MSFLFELYELYDERIAVDAIVSSNVSGASSLLEGRFEGSQWLEVLFVEG